MKKLTPPPRKISALVIIFLITILTTVVIYSCNKANSHLKQSTATTGQQSNSINKIPGPCPYQCDDPRCIGYTDYCGTLNTYNYAGVDIGYDNTNKMLIFASLNDLTSTLTKLDSAYESYNAAYENQYPNYTADQLDAKDAQTGFDNLKTYSDFELLFPSYVSKRSVIYNIESTWITNNFNWCRSR